MDRGDDKATDDEAIAMAFAHVEELANILHKAGHADVALLLNAMGDIGHLAERRRRRGGDPILVGASSELLDYVLLQMDDLAALMAARGLHDAAVLFAAPSQLNAQAQARRMRLIETDAPQAPLSRA